MVMVQSTMMRLGTRAPEFSLPDVADNRQVSLKDFEGKQALLVIFLCAHCPFVKHVAEELGKVSADYADKNVGMVGIMANDVSAHPDDAPGPMHVFAEANGWQFPVLYDESQAVAKSYSAACTPDIFLFDVNKRLIYRGQLDSSRPGNETPVTGEDLRSALEAVLEGKEVSPDQKPSSGCNIKWKAGNTPTYFG